MKKIFDHLATDWYKYLLELIVITAGVMGAFALNSWNEDRKIRNSEQTILRNLNDELLVNKQEFEKILVQHKNAVGSTYELLNYFREDISSVPEATFDSLINHSETYFTFEPIDGYMKSIISSGKLDNLQNEKLKAMISSFEGKVIDATQEAYHIHKLQHERLWPRQDGKISQYGLLKNLDKMGKYTKMSKEGYASDYEWFFQDREIEDILANILSWQLGAQDDEELLLVHMNEMLAIVKKELE